MNAIDCIKGRRSIREFTAEPVSHELIEQIVDVARFAPSWKNTQISRYIALEGALKDRVCAECVGEWNAGIIGRAPMLIVQTFVRNRSGFERDGSFTTSKEDRWQNYDAGIAAEAFCLAAHDAGLGTVIMGIFEEDKVASVLSLPEDQGVAALIAIGHPASNPEAPKRKEVSELLQFKS
ncbi:MAG: nitroreductase family protein [Lachnospiraceae bacterium]|nr:nitroreductase family protein [Lachnospiraceae bacterium]